MADQSLIRWNGVALGLYFMNAGDKIDMHQHKWKHTICLLCGEGEIEIVGSGITTMVIARNYILPENIDHEIRALKDGTIMVGMTDDRNVNEPKKPPPHGGVMLHDGTVVHNET